MPAWNMAFAGLGFTSHCNWTKMKVSAETKVGVLAVLALTALILGFDFLKGNSTFERGRTFYVYYDRVQGLQESDPVKINGLLIGRVKNMEVQDDYKIRVRLNITESVKIPSDSRARISSTDLLGAKQIDLIIGRGTQLAKSGDVLNGTIETSMQQEIQEQLAPITERFNALLGQIDSAVVIISGVIGGDSSNLNQSLVSVQEILFNFRQTSQRIDNLVAAESKTLRNITENIDTITSTISNNSSDITNIVQNLSKVSDSLANVELASTVGSVQDAVAALSDLIGRIEAGEGSLGLLLVDDELYNNLNNSSEDLDLLLKDIRENPQRYVTLLRIGGKK
jgi:phospholipid/cholesterol/gamma-HCH transport system substrate-binding protein